MIPFWPQPVWTIGPIAIHAFGLAQAVALVVGFALVILRARDTGLDDRRTGWLFIAGVLVGLTTGALTNLFSQGTSWRNPGESAMGVIAGALIVAGSAYVQFGAAIVADIDVLASTAPLIGGLARFGCFLAHDHRGMLSDGPFAVRFPEGSRIDLGLFDCVVALTLAGPIWLLWRTRPSAGMVTVTVVIATILLRVAGKFLK
jgi:phosphatidylglycerol---prolipoprotein diacylglyceryl transferase